MRAEREAGAAIRQAIRENRREDRQFREYKNRWQHRNHTHSGKFMGQISETEFQNERKTKNGGTDNGKNRN